MLRLSGESLNLTEDNLEMLKKNFPEVFYEGKIDFEKLRLLLGDSIEDKEERYEFTWNGKKDYIRIAQTPSTGTLRPDKESSKNWDDTENLYIEGDNLEVLKLLQKSYFGKVKMIYIDPPYNTGKDFVYKDNFRDNIANYKEITSQTTRSNPETNGRYHTDWLNMMYPRLKLARNLLKDDGVVFISIDNNEISNLKKMCDEIFGEENNLQTLIWKKKYTGGKHSNTFAEYHEYILVYCKDDNNICDISMDRPDEEKSKFEFSDNYIETRGRYYIRPLKSNLDPRPTLIYPIELPDGSTIITQWIVSKSTFEQMLKEERVLFKQKKDGNYQVYKKYYENDGEGKVKIPSIVEFASNSDAKEELKKIFNISQARELPFQTPKPTKLIKFFIKCFTDKNDIILDFFSGSSSTADSVIQTNAGDNNERKFIMVQLPELTNEKSEAYKSEYKNICEIGKERIRRTGDKIVSENKDKEGIENLDIGFKVFKLDSSNLKSWDSSMENLEQKLLQMDINLKKIEVKKIYYMKYY